MKKQPVWLFSVVIAVFVCLGQSAFGVTYFDDFSSYPIGGMNPPASGIYSANWYCNTPHRNDGTGGWFIGSDLAYAPSNGNFMALFGPPGGTNSQTVKFTVEEGQPITGANLKFDYLVQTNTNLNLSVSSVAPYTSFTTVPFTFTKRVNSGEIQDKTGIIDLTPYMSQTSSKLVVRFDGQATGSYASWIRLDNIALNTVPEPSTVALLAIGGIGLIAYGWRRRSA